MRYKSIHTPKDLKELSESDNLRLSHDDILKLNRSNTSRNNAIQKVLLSNGIVITRKFVILNDAISIGIGHIVKIVSTKPSGSLPPTIKFIGNQDECIHAITGPSNVVYTYLLEVIDGM